MQFNTKQLTTQMSFGGRVIFFKFPYNSYFAPKHLQPDELTFEERLSKHPHYFGVAYDYTMRNMSIIFKQTPYTEEELLAFVVASFKECKYQIR